MFGTEPFYYQTRGAFINDVRGGSLFCDAICECPNKNRHFSVTEGVGPGGDYIFLIYLTSFMKSPCKTLKG